MNGIAPDFLLPITLPASWIYGKVIAARNAKYDRGHNVVRINRPVISVGNITVGGSGKSPFVGWIVELLLAHSMRPAIAMRGYAARPGEKSDEQMEYEERFPNVPVIANPDRVTAIHEYLTTNSKIDCIVLDDGFQHRRLHRDLDLVVVDAQHIIRNDRLLPAGTLREPLNNLKRADAVIVTHASTVDDSISRRIDQYHGNPPIAWSRHVWNRLNVYNHSERPTHESTNWLAGKNVLTMLGIGKPQSVLSQLETLGANVAANIPAGDHEKYDRSKLAVARGLCDGCDCMLMTGKDWVKVKKLIEVSAWPVPIVVPDLTLDFVHGAMKLTEYVRSIL